MLILLLSLYGFVTSLAALFREKSISIDVFILIIVLFTVYIYLFSRPISAGDDLGNYLVWVGSVIDESGFNSLFSGYSNTGFSLIFNYFSFLKKPYIILGVVQSLIYSVVAVYLFKVGGIRPVIFLFLFMFFSRLYLDYSSNAIRGGIVALFIVPIIYRSGLFLFLIILLLSYFFHWKQAVFITCIFLVSLAMAKYDFLILKRVVSSWRLVILALLLAIAFRIFMLDGWLVHIASRLGALGPEAYDKLRLEYFLVVDVPFSWSLYSQVFFIVVLPYLLMIACTRSKEIFIVEKVFILLCLLAYIVLVGFYAPIERLMVYVLPLLYLTVSRLGSLKSSYSYIFLVLIPLNLFGMFSFYVN